MASMRTCQAMKALLIRGLVSAGLTKLHEEHIKDKTQVSSIVPEGTVPSP